MPTIYFFFCVLLLWGSTSFAQQRYQVSLRNGYGSGRFAAGDTVYVWAKEFALDSVFNGWESDVPSVVLLNPNEWNTRFIMPASDIHLSATFRYAPPLQWNELSLKIGPVQKPVWFSIPQNPRAVLTLHHFTNGRGKLWTERTEYTEFCHLARSMGYALIAYNCDEVDRGSQDGDQKDQWKALPLLTTDNPDHRNTRALLDSLIARGIISSSTPVFGVGMSVGGGYTLGAAFSIGYKGWANYCSGGQRAIADITTVPGIQAPALNDANADDAPVGENNKRAREVYERLVERGISAAWMQNLPQPLYPERFARVQGISKAKSSALFQELQQKGFLDAKNVPAIQSDTVEYLIKNAPKVLPEFSSLSERLWKEALFQYRVAYADHEFHTNFSHATLDFFETILRTSTSDVQELLQDAMPLKVLPNPTSGDARLYLKASEEESVVEVCDLLGVVRLSIILPAGATQLPFCADVPNGSYILRVRNLHGYITALFFVQR